MSNRIRFACDPKILSLPVSSILPVRKISPGMTKTEKYRRIARPTPTGGSSAGLRPDRGQAIHRRQGGRLPDTGPEHGSRRATSKVLLRRLHRNSYLALAAIIMAGLDGIRRRSEPPADGAPAMALRFPGDLGTALEALGGDRTFLTGPGVFSDELIDAWIEDRWEHHVLPVRSRPHPWELAHADIFGRVDDVRGVRDQEQLSSSEAATVPGSSCGPGLRTDLSDWGDES